MNKPDLSDQVNWFSEILKEVLKSESSGRREKRDEGKVKKFRLQKLPKFESWQKVK